MKNPKISPYYGDYVMAKEFDDPSKRPKTSLSGGLATGIDGKINWTEKFPTQNIHVIYGSKESFRDQIRLFINKVKRENQVDYLFEGLVKMNKKGEPV